MDSAKQTKLIQDIQPHTNKCFLSAERQHVPEDFTPLR